MTSPTSDMLALARESRGYSQTELARLLHVTQGYVSKLEGGLIEIPEDRLGAISGALHYPPEFFRQQPRFGDSPCLYHRKRQSLRVSDLRRIEASVMIAGLVVRNVMQGLQVEHERSFPVMDIDEYESPERIALLARAHWRLPSGPVKNLVRVIEAAGGVVVHEAFGTQKIDAISHWPSGERPLFVVNAEMPWDRVRFTLAHEIGHLVMHAVPSIDMEGEADRFASEFLMPADQIASDLEGVTLPRLAMLKAYWRVSMAALARRARDVQGITERQYRYLFMQLGRLGYRKVEPHPIAPEEPTVLADAIAAHRMNGLNDGDVSALARLNAREFNARFVGGANLHLMPGR